MHGVALQPRSIRPCRTFQQKIIAFSDEEKNLFLKRQPLLSPDSPFVAQQTMQLCLFPLSGFLLRLLFPERFPSNYLWRKPFRSIPEVTYSSRIKEDCLLSPSRIVSSCRLQCVELFSCSAQSDSRIILSKLHDDWGHPTGPTFNSQSHTFVTVFFFTLVLHKRHRR